MQRNAALFFYLPNGHTAWHMQTLRDSHSSYQERLPYSRYGSVLQEC